MNLNLSTHILIFLSISLNVFGGTIKGIVTDSRTGEPLTGADVIVKGTHMGAATDNNGFYIIENVPPGEYIINASFIVYGSQGDSISMKKHDDIIELNIVLKSPIVDLNSVSTQQLEMYHERIQEANKIRPAMRVTIDSLVYSKPYLSAYLSMTNQSNDSFYIFKNYPCFEVIKPIITDSRNKLITQNAVMVDCVGEKTCPDSADLIFIRPGQKIKYPATTLRFYNFSSFPHGTYFITIKYEFKKPEQINTFYCLGNTVINALITGLRGTYASSNTLTFVNH